MTTVNAKELTELLTKISDPTKLKKAVSNSLYNATAIEATFDKKIHEFNSGPNHVLENGIEFVTAGLSASIFVDTAKVKYAGFVYDGTKPHEIKAKGNGSLSWATGGNRFFAKSVQHPGYKGDPWIENNFKDRRKIYAKNFTNELVEEIEEIIK